MAYRINYRRRNCRYTGSRSFLRLPVWIAVFLMLFFAFVEILWPEGADFVEKTILGRDQTILVSALNDLADKLRFEDTAITAFSDFYRSLLP